MRLQINQGMSKRQLGRGGVCVQRNGRSRGCATRILRTTCNHVAGRDRPCGLREPLNSPPEREARRGDVPSPPLSGEQEASGDKESGNAHWLPGMEIPAGGLAEVKSNVAPLH